MMAAVVSMSLMSACHVLLAHMLLPTYDRGNPEPSGEVLPAVLMLSAAAAARSCRTRTRRRPSWSW